MSQQLAEFEPLTYEHVWKWVAALAKVLPNPPPRERLLSWTGGLWMVCQGYPTSVFCQKTQIECVARFKFWPAVAEVLEVLQPLARDAWADRCYRQPGGGHERPAARRIPPDEAEIAYVSQVVSNWKSQVEARRPSVAKSHGDWQTRRSRTDDLALRQLLEAQAVAGDARSAQRLADLTSRQDQR